MRRMYESLPPQGEIMESPDGIGIVVSRLPSRGGATFGSEDRFSDEADAFEEAMNAEFDSTISRPPTP